MYRSDGVLIEAALELEWNPERRRFAFSYHDSTFAGYKIAATNFDGSYYREYTTGEHIDSHPCWGPNGKILFDRSPLGSNEYSEHSAMVLDTETGAVRELVEPKTINGATGLRFPDF